MARCIERHDMLGLDVRIEVGAGRIDVDAVGQHNPANVAGCKVNETFRTSDLRRDHLELERQRACRAWTGNEMVRAEGKGCGA